MNTHKALHGASNAEIDVFRALAEMTAANKGRGHVPGYPGAYTPAQIARRAHVPFTARNAWHNLCVRHGLIEDAQHPRLTLYRLTDKGREVAAAMFPGASSSWEAAR